MQQVPDVAGGPSFGLAGAAAVPLIVALVEAAKQAGLPARWAALLAVVLGLLLSLGFQAAGGTSDSRGWADATLAGLALGLSAAGLYSGARATQGAQPDARDPRA